MIDILLGDDGDLADLDETGDMQLATGGEEVGQAAAIKLRSHKGEYRLDKRFGPDWINQVLKKPYSEAAAVRHVRAELMQVEELRSVGNVDITPNTDGRSASGEIEIQTIYGPQVINP